MSRAFLDTHVAYWLALDKKNLSGSTVALINKHAQCVVSSIMFAELEVKAMLGRAPDFSKLPEIFAENSIDIESFDYNATRSIPRFPGLIHHDPFDRMIFAQAAAKPNTTFFTADAELIALGLDWVVDARA